MTSRSFIFRRHSYIALHAQNPAEIVTKSKAVSRNLAGVFISAYDHSFEGNGIPVPISSNRMYQKFQGRLWPAHGYGTGSRPSLISFTLNLLW
jgi:hypothetical protein